MGPFEPSVLGRPRHTPEGAMKRLAIFTLTVLFHIGACDSATAPPDDPNNPPPTNPPPSDPPPSAPPVRTILTQRLDSYTGSQGRTCNESDIWLVESDGSNPRDISSTQDRDRTPAWGPSGKKIYFATQNAWSLDCAGLNGIQHFDIFVTNDDGGGRTNLTPGTAHGYDLMWVYPSGAYLQGDSTIPGPQAFDQHERYSNYRIDLDGGGVSRLGSISPLNHVDWFPIPSPDESRYVWVRRTTVLGSAGATLYLADIDGSNPRVLGPKSSNWSAAFWHPTDGSLAAVRTSGAGSELKRLDTGTLGQTDLVGTLAFVGFPDWDPNGHRLVVALGEGQGHELHMVQADGSGFAPLGDGLEGDIPRFSPDGSQVVYSNYETGQVMVVNADGSDPIAVAAGSYGEFSPDGRQVAVCNADGVAVVNSDGTGFVQVFNNGLGDFLCVRGMWRPE